MKKFATALLIAMFGLSIVGCNTTKGFGQDIEAVGDSIEDAAEGAKN